MEIPEKLARFPLVWRWSQSSHTIFGPTILKALHPLSPITANDLCKRSLFFIEDQFLREDCFVEIFTYQSNVSDEDGGTNWLRARTPDLDREVVVSWDFTTALRTTWRIFTAHWHDFCYEGSDDVCIFPPDMQWLFLFHHDGIFQFGSRKAEQGAAANP